MSFNLPLSITVILFGCSAASSLDGVSATEADLCELSLHGGSTISTSCRAHGFSTRMTSSSESASSTGERTRTTLSFNFQLFAEEEWVQQTYGNFNNALSTSSRISSLASSITCSNPFFKAHAFMAINMNNPQAHPSICRCNGGGYNTFCAQYSKSTLGAFRCSRIRSTTLMTN